MSPSRTSVLTAAVAVMAGATGFAIAEFKNTHQMILGLPDGTTAKIRYVGDTPPRLSLLPQPLTLATSLPLAAELDAGAPLAETDLISAGLDPQASLLLSPSDSLSALPMIASDGHGAPEWGQGPAGVQSFAVVAVLGGDSVCTRTLRFAGGGDRGPAQVVSSASLACEETGGRARAPATEAPSERGAPKVIQAGDTRPTTRT